MYVKSNWKQLTLTDKSLTTSFCRIRRRKKYINERNQFIFAARFKFRLKFKTLFVSFFAPYNSLHLIQKSIFFACMFGINKNKMKLISLKHNFYVDECLETADMADAYRIFFYYYLSVCLLRS